MIYYVYVIVGVTVASLCYHLGYVHGSARKYRNPSEPILPPLDDSNEWPGQQGPGERK
jgi:hypothetical protein